MKKIEFFFTIYFLSNPGPQKLQLLLYLSGFFLHFLDEEIGFYALGYNIYVSKKFYKKF